MEQLRGLHRRATGVVLAGRPVIARHGRTVVLGADHTADRDEGQWDEAAKEGLQK
ncbi:hypothetical protein [Methylorubrum extorquens]|uniref:Uncharacterized protein n=1 Tax=Methylorubrum extorquens TaxID=408 RepID=A0AAX3WK88_METEX|nr:hypothetical protein KEC54_10930 [Methylorubrum extorquens]